MARMSRERLPKRLAKVNRSVRNAALAVVLCTSLSAGAEAAPFYDNINGAFPLVGGANAGFNNQLIADDFVVPVGVSNLGSVTWTGVYRDGPAPAVGDDVFTIRIFADNSGFPSVTEHASETLSVTRTPSGIDLVPFSYTAVLSSPVSLTAGDTYWISLFNETTALTTTDWAWGISSPILNPGNMRFSNDITELGGLAGWFIPVGQFDPPTLDFALSSAAAVPAPATLPLFGAGLLGIWVIGRRRETRGRSLARLR